MKCIKVASADIQSELAALHALGTPPESGQPRRSVRLRVDLDPALAEGGILAIRSTYQERPIFLGPHAKEVTVSIDSGNLPEEGFDIWRLTLFRPEQGEVCLWRSDEGFPFWGGASRLRIRLLKDRQRLADGRVRAYEVESE